VKKILKKKDYLKVGLHLSLHEDIADKTVFYQTELIGWKRDHYLIADQPVLDGKPALLSKGLSFIGHFQLLRTVYGFETSLLDIRSKPFPIIFLAYPEIVKEMYLRRHKRLKTNVPASIYSIVKRNGEIRDLSEGGCLLATDYHYEVGSQFYLSFELPNGPNIEHLKAVVRNVRRADNKVLLGVEFGEILKK
jgi:hypothetical protein